MVYDGFGALLLGDRNATGTLTTDQYETDGLGNVVLHDLYFGDWHDAYFQSFNGPHLTQIASATGANAPNTTIRDTTVYLYDGSGNPTEANTAVSYHDSTNASGQDFSTTASSGQVWVWSYYDGAEQLRVSQRTAYIVTPGNAIKKRTTFQEYAYDALGRRVTLRTRRDSSCTGNNPTPGWDCVQTIERFVWDGAQLLVELRDYGGWNESIATLNLNGTSTGSFFGTVQYTNAPPGWGMDTPLQVQKLNVAALAIVPHQTWRGTYEAGTSTAGTNVTSFSWPARQQGVYLAPDARFTLAPDSAWSGSLVAGKTDASGLIYAGNGYYDPRAARVTNRSRISFDEAGSATICLSGCYGAGPNPLPFGELCTWVATDDDAEDAEIGDGNLTADASSAGSGPCPSTGSGGGAIGGGNTPAPRQTPTPQCTAAQQSAATLATALETASRNTGIIAFGAGVGTALAGAAEGVTLGGDTPFTITFASMMTVFGNTSAVTGAMGSLLNSFASGNIGAIEDFNTSHLTSIAAKLGASKIPLLAPWADTIGDLAEQAAHLGATAKEACHQ